jgi:hypothetical protein
LRKDLTTNFLVQYESTLPNQANEIANANALLAVVENEFTVTTGWFNTPGGKFGTGNRQVVNLNLTGGGNNSYGSAINVDGTTNAESAKMVFMNEWVEILMSLSGRKWNAGNSSGEGLSQYCGIVRFQVGHYKYYGSWVDSWLNQQPRQDWVNTTEGKDTNPVSFGCALAFIYYLNAQLTFSINQILAAGASNLATVYRTLTGDPCASAARFWRNAGIFKEQSQYFQRKLTRFDGAVHNIPKRSVKWRTLGLIARSTGNKTLPLALSPCCGKIIVPLRLSRSPNTVRNSPSFSADLALNANRSTMS